MTKKKINKAIEIYFSGNISKWVDFNNKLPQYYEVVEVETSDGKIFNMWRASDGDISFMTVRSTDTTHNNKVYLIEELNKWRLIYGKKEESSTQ